MTARTETEKFNDNLVQLARLALAGEHRQVEAFVRRLGRAFTKQQPALGEALLELVGTSVATRSAAMPQRSAGTRLVPVDIETRWDLLKVDHAPHVGASPVLAPALASRIEQVIAERRRAADLLRAGLDPTRTILFTGPPGVGKTLCAHWIAAQLGMPLFTLDLASVMSSLLGKTGINLRAVLEYAKVNEGILLIDEFDSVAKRRNDDTEVGELKRLVTVILQEIDRWPADRLLIAATNHGELLDPAVWRRFDVVVEFHLPDADELERLLDQELGSEAGITWVRTLSVIFQGRSFSDVQRAIRAVRRHALLADESIEKGLARLVTANVYGLPKAALKAIGRELELSGVPQRQISEMTGLSRDTIRRARQAEEHDG